MLGFKASPISASDAWAGELVLKIDGGSGRKQHNKVAARLLVRYLPKVKEHLICPVCERNKKDERGGAHWLLEATLIIPRYVKWLLFWPMVISHPYLDQNDMSTAGQRESSSSAGFEGADVASLGSIASPASGSFSASDCFANLWLFFAWSS